MTTWAKLTQTVNAVIEGLQRPEKKPRRRDGERWWARNEQGEWQEWEYWPSDRPDPDKVDYFAPGGVRRALDRMQRRQRPRW